jgi:hypothetical protein
MLDNWSIPANIKVDGNNIGSCFTIQTFADIPNIFCPEIPLLADSDKNTKWEEANKEIALIIIPTLTLLLYDMDIKSIVLDNDFIKEMQQLSVKHRFYAKMMVDAHEQYASDFDNSLVIKNLTIASMTSARCNPCQVAMKGFRDAMHTIPGLIVHTSRPVKNMSTSKITSRIFFLSKPNSCTR